MAQARNSAGNSYAARDPATALRDVEAVRLRAQDMTFQQIADALGMANKSTAKRAVDRVLDHVQVEAADELRAKERAVLEASRAKLLEIVYAAHVVVSNGRVTDVADYTPVIAAIRELRQVSESLRKLDGLDAPLRHKVETDESEVDRDIERLVAEVAARAQDGAPVPTES